MTDLLDEVVAAAGLSVFGVAATARPADVPAPFPFLPGPELTSRIASLRSDLRAQGLDRVVLCGPGAGAAAIAATLGLPLTVLDTADPHRLHAVLADVSRTVVVLAAPAPTVLTDALRRAFLQAFEDAGRHDPGRRLVVVTAPGSPYETFARELGAPLFLAPPTASALSAYALVPAGLAGADTAALLAEAEAFTAPPAPAQRRPIGFAAPAGFGPSPGPADAATHPAPVLPGVALGEAIAAAVRSGRDKLAVASDGTGIDGLGPWIERLFGSALVTVALENPSSWGHAGADVLGVTVGGVLGRAIMPGGGIRPDICVNGPLGAHLLVWEQAAMVAGSFAPPAVDTDNDLLRRLDGGRPAETPALVEGAVEVYGETGATTLIGAIDELARAVPPGGRVAIAAHLDPVGDVRIAQARDALAGRVDRAVTFGWGTRPGATLIITGAVTHDVRVPGKSYTFGELQAAAARTADGPVLRLHLTDRATGTEELLAALGG
ncbi:glucose-6-phosphate isomerase [Dactylosporangium vinaceum]|uniref:Glucose-6-phosphate isomerase n=1 Tax=Dactylosporangium vinaceum TaxID=53362 RepID=A0ABV5MBF6_9ACTN|nr:glucose-6-phosphate isomerase [Dactylosporangium vinaceum]UAB98410.1 glucose-6-phosphate isomerase [Dactylosporangium vinaceum]